MSETRDAITRGFELKRMLEGAKEGEKKDLYKEKRDAVALTKRCRFRYLLIFSFCLFIKHANFNENDGL